MNFSLLLYGCFLMLVTVQPAIGGQEIQNFSPQSSNTTSSDPEQKSWQTTPSWQAPQPNQQWQPVQPVPTQSAGRSQVLGQGQPNMAAPALATQNQTSFSGQSAGPSASLEETNANDAYREPGAYMNPNDSSGAFNDSMSVNAQKQDTNKPGGDTPQQGHARKNHEGLKSALLGVGRALEMGATVAAPMAGAYMVGKAMSAGAFSPYGYGMPMMPYGGYPSPYGMGVPMGLPMVNPGMSGFMHY